MSLPIETWAHIFRYLPLAQIHQLRQVNSHFDEAAEVALGVLYRHSSDWRYRLLMRQMHVFRVMPYLSRVRMKSTPFKDTLIDVGRCSTETGAYASEIDSNLDSTITKVALYGVMIDENRLVYRTPSEDGLCVIKVKSRETGKVTNQILLQHDHTFEGLCAIDMSRACIITTDGPHYIWSPEAAKAKAPNLKVWCPSDQFNLIEPAARINAQHLVISNQYVLTGDELKVEKIFHTDDLINKPQPVQSDRITTIITQLQSLLPTKTEFDYRLRGDYFVVFAYTQSPGKPRQIVRAAVYNMKSDKTSIIDPCDKFSQLPGSDGSDQDEEVDYEEECHWQSYRELTVVGDSQQYGEEVWLAQVTNKRSKRKRVKVYSLAEPNQPKLIIEIKRDIELSVCGPHLLLRSTNDDQDGTHMNVPRNEIGINFIRIEFNTLTWFYRSCFVMGYIVTILSFYQ